MTFTRRTFMETTCALSAGLVFGSLAHASTKVPEKWDETCSLLIIGTGFAGLGAALESHYLGMKDILVVDKMPSAGGNSIINGGAIAAAGTDMQEKAGIKDNADLLYSDILKAGGGLAHKELARRIADESVSNYKWLRDEVGVKFKAVTYHGGHSVPRSHAVMENSGAGFINPMLAKCKEFGIKIQLRTIVDDLIVNDKGCVVGVKARVNHRFNRPDSGKVVYIRATKGVLIASGGFSQNVKMRTSHDPRLTDAFGSTNHPGATGEVLQNMLAIGALPIQLDQIQLGPWSSPDERGFGLVSQFNTIAGFPKGIMVDKRTGKRFVNELADRKARSDAILKQLDENGKPVYPICFTDSVGVKQAQTLKNGLKYGVIKKFDTLGELADAYGIPKEALIKQVEEFNAYVREGKDKQFDRPLALAIEIKKAPFYAARVWPKVHYCMGGVGITKNAEVLNVRTQKPIPGLYAAGEVTGGTHGASRLGGCAIADGLVTGRVAGDAVVANTPVNLE